MSLRGAWEPKYLVELQATAITTAGTFVGTNFGPVVDKCLLEAIGQPEMNSGFESIFNQKAIGSPTDYKGTATSGEHHVGVSKPSIQVETDYNANLATIYLLLLGQNGVSEAVGTPFVKTLAKTSYTAEAVWWASIVELLSKTTAAENKIINGAIVSQLTVSGDSSGNQVIRAQPTFMGGGFAATFDASSVDADVSPDINSLLFKNMVCKLDTSVAQLDSFTFTLLNNAASKPFNNGSVQKHILGRLQATGQIVVPRDCGVAAFDDNGFQTKFEANTDFTLELYWGANPATANGHLAHSFNCQITGVVPQIVEGEMCNQVSWRSMDDGTNDIGASWADNIDRGI